VLSLLLIRAVPVYEARLDREYEELVRSNPPPAAPLLAEALPLGEQPQEQMDVTASEDARPQTADNARPPATEPRWEREPSPARTVAQPSKMYQAPQTKKTPPSPPMIAPGSVGQGLPQNPTPAGVATVLPGRTNAPSDPPPPPAQPPSSLVRAEPISRVRPDYPSIARSTGQGGSVIVEVTISEKGDVVAARAVSGPQMLRESATAAARRWKFKPATRDGKPVSGAMSIVFNFKR
jgi:protein TonB